MAYRTDFLDKVAKANGALLGVRLGRLLISRSVSIGKAAKLLDVSRTTIYSWAVGEVGVSKHLTAAVAGLCEKLEAGSVPHE